MRRLQKTYPYTTLIALTARSSFSFERKLKAGGAYGILKKPIDADVLEEQLHNIEKFSSIMKKVTLLGIGEDEEHIITEILTNEGYEVFSGEGVEIYGICIVDVHSYPDAKNRIEEIS
ncbi:MAG: hypothetical protein QF682_10735 [Candidatus Thermoplasmatota archaeon]|jgi:hypothetical protein|nr:hypothetical protein [Candidatus Thermoplasmatota archaeon]